MTILLISWVCASAAFLLALLSVAARRAPRIDEPMAAGCQPALRQKTAGVLEKPAAAYPPFMAYEATLKGFQQYASEHLADRGPDQLTAGDMFKSCLSCQLRHLAWLVVRLLPVQSVSTGEAWFKYLEYLRQERHNGASALNRQATVLRNFYRAMAAMGHLEPRQKPMAHFPKIKAAPRKLPTTLSREVVTTLIEQPETDTVLGVRDRALLTLLYGTGIHASECSGLAECDVNWEERTIRVTGKGGHYAKVVVMQRCHAVGTNLNPTPTGICGASESTNALQLRPDLGLAMPEQSPAGGVVRRRMRGTRLDITPTPSVLGFVRADAIRIEPVTGGHSPKPVSAWPGCISQMPR